MKKMILLSFILSAGTTLALAQWQFTGGPANDTVNSLLVNGNNLLAATNVGIYFTTSDASGWLPETNSLTCGKMGSLASNGMDIFGSCPYKGIFLSADSGVSWKAANNGFADSTSVSCVIGYGSDIFAGTAGAGVYISADNGLSWNQVKNGLLNLSVNSLAVNNNFIFAATQKSIFESADVGASWLPINFKNVNVTSLAIMANTLFAGTDSGLYVSADDGANWQQAGNGLTAGHVYSLVENGNDIVAGTDKGVFLSIDDGVNWVAANDGLGMIAVSSMVLFNNDVYIGTEGNGVWKRALTDILSGVKNVIANDGINIYPNPASTTLTISSEQLLNKDVEITDLLGRSLFFQKVSSSLKQTTIDVSGLPQGEYLVSIKNNNRVEWVRKFVKE